MCRFVQYGFNSLGYWTGRFRVMFLLLGMILVISIWIYGVFPHRSPFFLLGGCHPEWLSDLTLVLAGRHPSESNFQGYMLLKKTSLLGCVIENRKDEPVCFHWLSDASAMSFTRWTLYMWLWKYVCVLFIHSPHSVSAVIARHVQMWDSTGPIWPVSRSCTPFAGSNPLVLSPTLENPLSHQPAMYNCITVVVISRICVL